MFINLRTAHEEDYLKNWSGLNILSGTENFSSTLTSGITVKNGKKEMWESYDSLHGS